MRKSKCLVALLSLAVTSASVFGQSSKLPELKNKKVLNVRKIGKDGPVENLTQITPFIYGQVILNVDSKGYLYITDLKNNKHLKKHILADQVVDTKKLRLANLKLSGGIALDRKNNILAIPSESARLYVLSADKLQYKKMLRTSGPVLSKPLIFNDKLMVQTTNGYVDIFDIKNNYKYEKVGLGQRSIFSLKGGASLTVINEDLIAVSDKKGYVHFLDPKNSRIKPGAYYVSGPIKEQGLVGSINSIIGDPVLINDTLVVAPYNGDLTGLDVSDQSRLKVKYKFKKSLLKQCKLMGKKNIKHKEPNSLGTFNNLSKYRGYVYLVDPQDRIFRVKGEDGSICNYFETLAYENKGLTATAFYKDKLIVGDKKGYVFALDPDNGEILSYKRISKYHLASNPVIVKNKGVMFIDALGNKYLVNI